MTAHAHSVPRERNRPLPNRVIMAAEAPTSSSLPEGVVEKFPDDITKEDVRPYFTTIDCSLRVLGSQFGIDPGKLTDLERCSAPSDLRLLLLDECFKLEKITSWHQFVTVLEKPALNQNGIADDIRRRFGSVNRQVSMDSAASSSSMTGASPMSPSQSISSMEVSGSAFSSSMGTQTQRGRIELCDAVNEVMKVSYYNLRNLGRNLGLDEDRIQDLLSMTQYQPWPEEKRQRLVEMWFRNESEPTWEKLHRAIKLVQLIRPTSLRLGESSTLTNSVLIVSPTTTNSMLRSNLEDIESRFSDLLYSVRCALEANNVQVDHVRQILIGIFHRDDCIPRSTLEEIFSAVTAHKLWDYNHHSPLEKLVHRCLRDHISEVTEYKGHLSGFYATIKLIDYIRCTTFVNTRRGSSELPLDRYNTEYDTLTLKLDTERDISQWSLMYVQELWNSVAEEFRIPSLTAVIDKILEGCLEITWLILPNAAKQIATLAPESTPYFHHLGVIYVSLNGHTIYNNVNKMDVQESEQPTLSLMALEDKGQFIEGQMSVPDSIPVVPQTLKIAPTHRRVLQYPSSSTDVEFMIDGFERQFTELSTKTKAELQMKRTVDKVYATLLLKTLPGRDFHKYVLKLRGSPPSNFDELFDDLNSYCGSCFEYGVLEALITGNKSHCSTALWKDMEQYAHTVQKFRQNTAVSKLINKRFQKRRSPLKGHKNLRTRHNIDPEQYMVSTIIDPVQQEVWSKSGCWLRYISAELGSVEIEWEFHEEHEHTLIQFFCDEDGRTLLEQHCISDVYINDIHVDHSLLLLISAAHGDWETVSALLQDKTKDVNLNCLNENGQTALFYVSAKGGGLLDVLKLMLEQGANPNVQDIDGWTPLMKAAKAGYGEIIEVFLQRRSEINLQENVHGWSVLHIAANSGQADVVRALIELSSEIDITLKDKDGKTALQLAQEGGHTEVVGLLKSIRDLDQDSTRTAESWFSYLEGQFLKLLTEACSELEFKNNAVALNNKKQFPDPILSMHHSYVCLSIQRSTFFPNLSVFIRHLYLYSWNFFEHDMLEFLVKQNCSEKLKAKMTNFVKEVNHYLQQTNLTDFINCRCQIIKKTNVPPQFKDITTEHNIDPNDHTLYDTEAFRKELHRLLNVQHASECTCALQMYSIERTKDRVVVQWIFPEELMGKFFYAEYKELMTRREIDTLRVDGMSSHSLSFLRAVREEDIDTINSNLQDVDLDIDVNCCDHNTGCTPINFAARQGNLEVVEKLFSKGADVNIIDKRGRTALMAAVEGGHKKVVEVLLDLETKHLCDTNIQEKVLGWTALHFAADKGQKDIIDLLIDPILQTDFTIRDKDGRTAAQIAEHEQYTELVELLCPSSTTDTEGDETKLPKIRLPLQWPSLKRNKLIQAAKRGSLAEVKKLLEKGEHPDSCDKRKWTALLHASHNGYEEIVRVLLEKGADPSWRSADGGYTALILAGYRGFIEVLELLLKHKADVNIQAKNGSTALQLVCLYSPLRARGDKFPTKRRCEVVRLLLRYGADVNLADTLDRTPLIAASGSGFPDVVRILLEAIKDFSDEDEEAYLNRVMNRSWTALMKASQIGDVNIVKMLMGAGASLKIKAEDGVTALHIAVYNKHPGVVKVLAKKGDSEVLNACDIYGYTPLILAVKANNYEAVKVLLQSKADLNLPTKDGKQMTALMFAVQHGYFDIIQMFISNKATDLLIKDSKQRTAGDMAKNKALRKSLYELQEQRSQGLQPVA